MSAKGRKKKARARTTSPRTVDAARSAVMRAVRGSGTHPEVVVRALVRRLGYRATFNKRSLPGKPDIVARAMRKVIFVHGCFWHGHSCKRGRRIPKANRKYWIKKVASNRSRHRKAVRLLRTSGWSTLTLWECQLHDIARALLRIERFLSGHLVSARSARS